jgi:hypothetical protein
VHKGESDSNLNPGTKDVSVRHEVWNAANASLVFEEALNNAHRALPARFASEGLRSKEETGLKSFC